MGGGGGWGMQVDSGDERERVERRKFLYIVIDWFRLISMSGHASSWIPGRLL